MTKKKAVSGIMILSLRGYYKLGIVTGFADYTVDLFSSPCVFRDNFFFLPRLHSGAFFDTRSWSFRRYVIAAVKAGSVSNIGT